MRDGGGSAVITGLVQVSLPESVDDALALLDEDVDGAVVVGGGTWVVPEMTRGTRRPTRVIELRRAGLDAITLTDGALVVGATCTYEQLAASELVQATHPALVDLARGVNGGVQVRSWATIGGSACYASPASDVPGALVGLDATLCLRTGRGRRDVPAREFLLGSYRSDVRRGEILCEIRFPILATDAATAYRKFTLCASSWPIVTALAVVRDGSARVAMAGVGAVPIAFTVPTAGVGHDDDALSDAIGALVVDPWEDVLADAAYRRAIAPVIARRAIGAAAAWKNGAQA
jgi:CO/xanthine dehydrogenase FAD-binding subunit